MFLTAYPSADVLSQEAHEAIAKQRASGMFQGFLIAIRLAVKNEQSLKFIISEDSDGIHLEKINSKSKITNSK